MGAAIETQNLTCRYGRTEAVQGLDLTVPFGTLFALLGPNGAGKTTTIRTLMNILHPSSGKSIVLGTDTRRLGPSQFRTIGHVSESQKLPAAMTVSQLLSFCRPLYPAWDEALCRTLIQLFDLPLDVKIGRLSRGMRVKAALVSSIAYRPKLLVLDEPFSGLDPVVRDDLVRGVLELAGQEHWTVLISSHDIDEVERLVDTVAFIDAGRLVLSESLARLQTRFRRIEVSGNRVPGSGFLEAGADARVEESLAPSMPESWIDIHTTGRIVRLVDTRYEAGESERRLAAVFPDATVDAQPMTLREIFVAMARQRREVRR